MASGPHESIVSFANFFAKSLQMANEIAACPDISTLSQRLFLCALRLGKVVSASRDAWVFGATRQILLIYL
jgi:hypothetical protein